MNRSSVLVALCVLVVIGAVVGAPVSAQPADDTGVPVVVVFDDQSAKNPQAIEASGGRVTGGANVDVAPVLFATVPAPAREAIASRPGVQSVSADVEFQTFAQTTDWGVDTIGARTTAAGVNESGVTVAVVDTGVDATHPDLGDRVGWGVNTVGTGYTDGAASADDGNGHGTHVAGIIAAQDNDRGTVGVAPQAQLYAMKALADDGTGTLSDVIEAVDLSVKGPDGTIGTDDDTDVVSLSLGTSTDSDALERAITGASDHATVVAAAGNAGDGDADTDTVQYPAKYDGVIGVAATDGGAAIPTWSSEGAAVDLAAPGVNVVSTYSGGEYRSMSGTSMAAPHVSGTVALYLAAETARTGTTPTGSEVQAALADAALDIGPAGVDTQSGAGLVQADAIDTASPAGSIVAPTAGETLENETQVVVDARHPSASPSSLSVEYAVDNGTWQPLTYNATTERFTGTWNTTTVDDGAHQLWVWIGDSNGDSVNRSVSVQVSNVAPTPTVSFATPTDGSTVNDAQPIALNASANGTPPGQLSVAYQVDTGAWESLSYDAEAGTFSGEWNTTGLDPGRYTLTGYAETDAGVAATTQLDVYKENTTVPPGQQFSSIAELVQAQLAGELEGRAFGQRIAAAASDQQRAAVAAEQQARLEARLEETLAERPSRARAARLRTIHDLSTDQTAVVRSLPSSTRDAEGLDVRDGEAVRDRSQAVGATVTDAGPGPMPATRPGSSGGRADDDSTDETASGERGSAPTPPQGPPERRGGDAERGPPGENSGAGAGDGAPGQSGGGSPGGASDGSPGAGSGSGTGNGDANSGGNGNGAQSGDGENSGGNGANGNGDASGNGDANGNSGGNSDNGNGASDNGNSNGGDNGASGSSGNSNGGDNGASGSSGNSNGGDNSAGGNSGGNSNGGDNGASGSSGGSNGGDNSAGGSSGNSNGGDNSAGGSSGGNSNGGDTGGDNSAGGSSGNSNGGSSGASGDSGSSNSGGNGGSNGGGNDGSSSDRGSGNNAGGASPRSSLGSS